MAQGKYTVNEVEERTKVPASTLRQWERRYGFPKPERSDAGYRLYSDLDLDHIEAMKRHIAEGIPASRAAELVKRITPIPTNPRPIHDLRKELFAALVELDETRAGEVLSEAHSLHTVEAVILELMQGVMVDVGQAWHDGRINVTTEHFASSYLLGRLRALLNLASSARNAPAVIVACAPHDHHEIGALTLAVLLRRAGYRTYFIGANTPVGDLSETAKRLQPIGVMISATTQDSPQALLDNRHLLQGLAPIVAFGGPAFRERPELARALGGVYLGEPVIAAIERFHQLVQEHGAVNA